MGTDKWIISCVLLIGCLTPLIAAKKTVVCYSVAWAITRLGDGQYDVTNADIDHCTHVIYAFMALDQDTSEIKSVDPRIDLNPNGRGFNQLAKLKELKKKNPSLKVMVSIGGYNEEGRKFSNVAGDPELRQKFIKSIMEFIKKYELNGIDICWQFPGQRGGRKEDKENSVILFQEIKDSFAPFGYVLTVHILGKKYIIDSYNIGAVAEVVDFINLIPLEFSGPWDRTTGVFSPLTSKNQNNVKFVVEYVVKKVANPKKILLGLPLYGHAYVLEETPKANNLIGLFSDKTYHGPWTNEGGVIASYENCINFKNETGWNQVWDEPSQTPLAFNEKRFTSYENERSLLLKADLVEEKNLGGVMFWSLDMDDFRGICKGKKFPVVSAVTDYINRKETGMPSEHEGEATTKSSQGGAEEFGEDTDDLGSPDQYGKGKTTSGPNPASDRTPPNPSEQATLKYPASYFPEGSPYEKPTSIWIVLIRKIRQVVNL